MTIYWNICLALSHLQYRHGTLLSALEYLLLKSSDTVWKRTPDMRMSRGEQRYMLRGTSLRNLRTRLQNINIER